MFSRHSVLFSLWFSLGNRSVAIPTECIRRKLIGEKNYYIFLINRRLEMYALVFFFSKPPWEKENDTRRKKPHNFLPCLLQRRKEASFMHRQLRLHLLRRHWLKACFAGGSHSTRDDCGCWSNPPRRLLDCFSRWKDSFLGLLGAETRAGVWYPPSHLLYGNFFLSVS